MARKVKMTVVTIVVEVIMGVHIHGIMVCMMLMIGRGGTLCVWATVVLDISSSVEDQ